MKNFLILSLCTLLAAGCSRDELPVSDTEYVRLTLDLQTKEQAVLTRAVDENALTDFNLFVYRQGETHPYEHMYTSEHHFAIELVPGNYDFRVVANLHKDLGNLEKADLDNYTDYDSENNETLVMVGRTERLIDSSAQTLTIELRRKAAKIGYNVTLAQKAIEAGIVLTSVRLCNLPDEAGLFDAGDRTTTARFHDSEMRIFNESSIAANGVFYMLPNPQGIIPGIISQADKNHRNAPEHASYLRIRGKKGDGKIIDWNVYLGANNTDDFNVRSNEAHTYDITIHSDGETDTRITSWIFECADSWPHMYNSPADTGLFRYTIENTSEHRLTGLFRVIQGDNDKLIITDRNDGRNTCPPYNFEAARYGELSLAYAPELVKQGENSRLEYRAEVTDETGETVDYTFINEFANRVQVFATEADLAKVNVTETLDRENASDRIIAWCYEDGCKMSIKVAAGERFDGWYADAEYTQRLSADTEFRYMPTQAEETVYVRIAIPEATIICRETNKNATYMYNDNVVDLTVADYSGTVTVRATCADGGVFATGAEQTVSVVAGQRITLNPIRFVPLKAGSVTYVIEVHTADGQKIGTAEVSNTIKPTKLTPKIRVYYDGPERQQGYNLDGGLVTDSTAVYWYGYTKIKADVTFAPTVDYPEPLAGKTLAKIKLKPTPSVTRLRSEWDILDTGPIWHAGWQHINVDNCPDLDEIEVVYAPAATPKSYCLMAIERIPDYNDNVNYPTLDNTQLFAPYTEGYNNVILPEDESNLDYGLLTNRVFVYYNFSYPKLKESEVSISAFYNGLDFDTKTIDEIIINDLNR